MTCTCESCGGPVECGWDYCSRCQDLGLAERGLEPDGGRLERPEKQYRCRDPWEIVRDHSRRYGCPGCMRVFRFVDSHAPPEMCPWCGDEDVGEMSGSTTDSTSGGDDG